MKDGLSNVPGHESSAYIEQALAKRWVARLTMAGDNLAALLDEPLATEGERQECLENWERVRAEIGKAVGLR